MIHNDSSEYTNFLSILVFVIINVKYSYLGSSSQDADSDEEWPALGAGGAADIDVECDTEVVVDPDDEKAIEMFMNKNPPMRQDFTVFNVVFGISGAEALTSVCLSVCLTVQTYLS